MCYACIEGLNQDQIAYATQASEAIFAVSSQQETNLTEVRMEILRENYDHCDDFLYVAFNKIDEKILSKLSSKIISKGLKFEIYFEFEVKHSFFNCLIKAVNGIQSEIIRRLFPINNSFQRHPTYPEGYERRFLPPESFEMNLDNNQRSGLFKILTIGSGQPPILINGPFGTGKTRLLAVAAYALIKQGKAENRPVRVLVCAHHQGTADNFVEKYFGKMAQDANFQLIRLTSPNYHVKSKKFQQYYKARRDMNSFRRQNSQYIIVATTFLTAPSLKYIVGDKFFTHILMDEGSQSREPEAIAPLSLASNTTKLVIAGDPEQVSGLSVKKCSTVKTEEELYQYSYCIQLCANILPVSLQDTNH